MSHELRQRIRDDSVIDAMGCWLWSGYINRDGYGQMQMTNGNQLAHRMSYTAFIGDIPNALTVDHLCFVPRCVNPHHLRLLSHAENARHQLASFKTHCKNGHEFSEENTLIRKWRKSASGRQCRACNREAAARYRSRRAA